MLLKALRCVAEEKAENDGRRKVEEKIVKSITEVITRIDDGGGGEAHNDLNRKTGRWGSACVCGHLGHLIRKQHQRRVDSRRRQIELPCRRACPKRLLDKTILGVVSKRR